MSAAHRAGQCPERVPKPFPIHALPFLYMANPSSAFGRKKSEKNICVCLFVNTSVLRFFTSIALGGGVRRAGGRLGVFVHVVTEIGGVHLLVDRHRLQEQMFSSHYLF